MIYIGANNSKSSIMHGLSLILILIFISCSNITKSDDPKDVGDIAPNFSLEALSGEQVMLTDFKDKVVLLFFFGDA